MDPRDGGEDGDAFAADGFNNARGDQAVFKVQLGAKMEGTHRPMVWPKTWLSGSVCKMRRG